jgi:hypothetical protein
VEAARFDQLNWLEPKFCIPLGVLNVDVAWLVPFAAKKEKSDSCGREELLACPSILLA